MRRVRLLLLPRAPHQLPVALPVRPQHVQLGAVPLPQALDEVDQVVLLGDLRLGQGLVGPRPQQVDIGVGGVLERLVVDAAQLALLLPDLALGPHLLVGVLAQVQLAVDLGAGEQGTRAGVDQHAVLVLDAALVPVVGRADVQARQPAELGHVQVGAGAVDALPGQAHLRVLVLGQAEDRVQADRQLLRRGGLGGDRRGRGQDVAGGRGGRRGPLRLRNRHVGHALAGDLGVLGGRGAGEGQRGQAGQAEAEATGQGAAAGTVHERFSNRGRQGKLAVLPSLSVIGVLNFLLYGAGDGKPRKREGGTKGARVPGHRRRCGAPVGKPPFTGRGGDVIRQRGRRPRPGRRPATHEP